MLEYYMYMKYLSAFPSSIIIDFMLVCLSQFHG